MLILFVLDAYESPALRRPEREFEIICKAVVVTFLSIFLLSLETLKIQVSYRYLFVLWFVLTLALLLVERFSLRLFFAHLYRAGIGRRKAVLLGTPENFASYQEKLAIQRHRGYQLVGFILDSPGGAISAGGNVLLPTLGTIDHMDEILPRVGADVVIAEFCCVSRDRALLNRLLAQCRELRIGLELYSDVLASSDLNYQRDEFSGCVRFSSRPWWSTSVQCLLKKGLDFVIGMVGSAVTLLLTPVVGLLIKLEDGGPIFFSREFVGCDGDVHFYRKFRTMLMNADQILEGNPELKAQFSEKCKLADDPRVLRVGKFLRKYSLDEFPQFFSLLSGDLTFVGPRVISRVEKERYGSLLPKLLSVKPGLTGFWQVMGRQTTSYEDRIGMDMFYIDRWSVWLDLVIMAKTFWKVLKAEGAH